MTPRVSVLMAVFNGAKYLPEAIDSILGQTFTDFDFLIIDDGSTDRTREIIDSYQDPKIKLIRNQQNVGLTHSLNKGLDLARGEYIARMDSDDISLPDRLARQVAYMDVHPEVAVCGTWAKDIDLDGKVIGVRETPIGKDLEHNYWRPSPIIHPSAMIRRADLNGLRYDEQMRYAQDFDLWLRMRVKHKLANLPEHLLLYRVHRDSITSSRRDEQLLATYDIFSERTGAKLTLDEFVALNSYSVNLTPLRRTWAMGKLAKAIRQPHRVFLRDNVRYTRLWIKNCLYKAAIKTRILKKRTRTIAG
jgi:glycosyltransferase involved in cell wall biosynthesis